MDQRPHTLYRFWSAQDVLLYVGITVNPLARWGRHERDKPWWPSVTRVTVEHFSTRSAVLTAEKAAIIAESPLHNVHHNQNRTAEVVSDELASYATSLAVDNGQPGRHNRGDCVAVATPNGCPVGLVIGVDDSGVRLLLMSFWSGEFDQGESFIPWNRVLDIRIASVKHGQTAVFDTDPLAAYQTRWKDQLKALGTPVA
jgi:hypothetical protein